jgi:hypothetical protein
MKIYDKDIYDLSYHKKSDLFKSGLEEIYCEGKKHNAKLVELGNPESTEKEKEFADLLMDRELPKPCSEERDFCVPYMMSVLHGVDYDVMEKQMRMFCHSSRRTKIIVNRKLEATGGKITGVSLEEQNHMFMHSQLMRKAKKATYDFELYEGDVERTNSPTARKTASYEWGYENEDYLVADTGDYFLLPEPVEDPEMEEPLYIGKITPTLGRFLDEVVTGDAVYQIGVTDHAMLICKDKILDNHKQEWIDFSDIHFRRKKMRYFSKVHALSGFNFGKGIA